MTRILLYSDRNGIYGAEQINHRLALGFREAGHEVTVALPPGTNPLTDTLARAGIARHDLPAENVYDRRHPADSLTDERVALDCFASVRPDLVLFGDGFPFSSLAAKHAAHRFGVDFVALLHCVRPDWATHFAGFLPSLRAAWASAREVVAVSANNLGMLRSLYGLPDTRGRVILCGRPPHFLLPRDETARRRLRREWGVADDAVVAMTVGRFDHEKGYDLLLDALPLLRRAPAWKRLAFAWVGDGPLRPRAERLARLVGDGRVHVLGEHRDVAPLLDAADLLVHPSRAEGLPLVVLEAMAKGLPVIASPVGGIPEALGDAGVLLPETGDPTFRQGLAEALNALALDEPRRHSLGQCARARAGREFTESRMVGEWLDLVGETPGHRR